MYQKGKYILTDPYLVFDKNIDLFHDALQKSKPPVINGKKFYLETSVATGLVSSDERFRIRTDSESVALLPIEFIEIDGILDTTKESDYFVILDFKEGFDCKTIFDDEFWVESGFKTGNIEFHFWDEEKHPSAEPDHIY